MGPIDTADDMMGDERPRSEDNADRRSSARRCPDEVPWIRTVKLSQREEAQIINVSSSGILIECRTRLPLGAAIVLQLIGPGNRLNLKGRVLRCEVASVDAVTGLTYKAAIAFEPDPCPLPVVSHLSNSMDREPGWLYTSYTPPPVPAGWAGFAGPQQKPESGAKLPKDARASSEGDTRSGDNAGSSETRIPRRT